MRKQTKLGKKKKREKALKLIQNGSPLDALKGRKLLKQVNRVPWGNFTKSNY
jgi:hypothetical protein